MSAVNYETGEITIPAFVMRGLAMMSDPANIETTSYRSEADLRDAMAAHWWLHGWSVRTEVKIPDCGRVDVLAEFGETQVVIEMKKRIVTATTARQAYQQAHAYEAYLRAQRKRQHTFVAAVEFAWDVAQAAERAFAPVWGDHFLGIAAFATDRDLGVPLDALRINAMHRRRAIESLLDAARARENAVVMALESGRFDKESA